MKHFDRILKQYAESGLRSAGEWASLGREVSATEVGTILTTDKAGKVALYTRNQTHMKPKLQPVTPAKAATASAIR
jgi:hypothetical protein